MMLMAVMERFERIATCTFVPIDAAKSVLRTVHAWFKTKDLVRFVGCARVCLYRLGDPAKGKKPIRMVALKDVDLVLDCCSHIRTMIGREGAKYSLF